VTGAQKPKKRMSRHYLSPKEEKAYLKKKDPNIKLTSFLDTLKPVKTRKKKRIGG